MNLKTNSGLPCCAFQWPSSPPPPHCLGGPVLGSASHQSQGPIAVPGLCSCPQLWPQPGMLRGCQFSQTEQTTCHLQQWSPIRDSSKPDLNRSKGRRVPLSTPTPKIVPMPLIMGPPLEIHSRSEVLQFSLGFSSSYSS